MDAGFELEEKMPHLSSSINKHDAIVQALDDVTHIQNVTAENKYDAAGAAQAFIQMGEIF